MKCRPKRRWIDNIKDDFREKELTVEKARNGLFGDMGLFSSMNPSQINVGKDSHEEQIEVSYKIIIWK